MPEETTSTETVETEEVVETTPADKPEEKPELSPEDLRALVTKANAEAANYRTKLRDAEAKLGTAKTQEEFEAARNELIAENQRLERSLLVNSVASKHELPADLADLLKGETEEELVAHAKTLAKYVAAGQEPGDLKGGLTPDDENDPDGNNPAALAKKYGRGRRSA